MKRLLPNLILGLIVGVICHLLNLSNLITLLVLIGIFFIVKLPIIPLFLSLIMPIAGIGLHIYTVVLAFGFGIWKGILTLFLPIISEIYWFFKFTNIEGTVKNTFSMIVLVYVSSYLIMFISPILFNIFSGKLTDD